MGALREKLKNNIYVQLFLEFFYIGAFTFGGGMAMVSLLQDRMCDRKKWLTQEEVMDCIAITQTLPGVVASNMSVYVGYKKKGVKGAIVSWIGMVIPSFVIIVLIAAFLGMIYENPYVQGCMTGIRAAAAGIIAYTLLNMAKKTLRSGGRGKISLIFNVSMMVLAFTAVAILGVDAGWVILGAILIGMGYLAVLVRKVSGGEEK